MINWMLKSKLAIKLSNLVAWKHGVHEMVNMKCTFNIH